MSETTICPFHILWKLICVWAKLQNSSKSKFPNVLVSFANIDFTPKLIIRKIQRYPTFVPDYEQFWKLNFFKSIFWKNCFVAYDVSLFNKFTENGKKINSDGWQTLLCLWRSFDASWPVCWSRVLTRLTPFGPWSTPATAVGITIGSQQVYFLLTDDYIWNRCSSSFNDY